MKDCFRKYKGKKKRHIYRKHVIFELYETEDRYVLDLDFIIKKVLVPIKNENILDEDQIKKVFNNIESICALNKVFCNDLKSKIIFIDIYIYIYIYRN